MRLGSIGVRNVARNKFRTLLTVLGVAVAILAFVLVRTVLTSWTAAADHAAKDRVATRHKVSFVMSLPYKYVQEIENIPGVSLAMHANWFGAKDPNNEQDFFATIAVDEQKMFQMYDEIEVPPEQREAWLQDRRGALVGDVLAKKRGWKVGDRITLRGTIFPGDWQFNIAGIYTTTRRSIDRSTLWFHYDYLNEWVGQNRPRYKDQIGWVMARIDDPSQAAAISHAIDEHFSDRDIQTLSMSERALNTSFLGMVSAVLKALDIVSVVILVIMILILGNTIAMGVRERTHEYGVMRAIGFSPKHLARFVYGEALVTGLLGGALGLLLAYPFVNQVVGRFLEENMGGLFPYFRVDPGTALAAIVLAGVLGLLAAALPAYQASKLDVVTSLRKVG